jgi:hypothetical protein
VTIAIRIVGAFFLLLGVISIVGLAYIGFSMVISPTVVVVRYSLMLVYGVGFLLLRRWAIFVYLGALAFNWIAFFTVYERALPVPFDAPIWVSLLFPIGIVGLTWFAWPKLKSGFIGT